jgi:hypothetical protein
VLTAIAVSNDWLAIGTNLDGTYIVNKRGEIIQNLSRKEGLQNNNILHLFLDKNKNLWLGLDNGIDFIAYNNAIKHIYPEKLNEGLGYIAYIYDKELFVGTSNGLYSIPAEEREDLSFLRGEFKSIPGTKGSTWGLSEVNGSLLLGHHDGAFRIENDRLITIDTGTSYWAFLPFSNVLPSSLILGGNDKGIDLIRYENNRFTSLGNIPGFLAAAQFMAIDNNNTVWVAHPYRGVYKLDLNDTAHIRVKLYTENNGLPSYLKNHLFKIKNHIVVATEKGVYEYNPQTASFAPSAWFKPYFGEMNIRYLREDGAGNIWFMEDNNLGVVDLSGPQPETIYFPELSGKLVADYELIYPYDKFNVFVGAEKGFYHINYEEYKQNRYPIEAGIRAVRAFGKTDSLLFGGISGKWGIAWINRRQQCATSRSNGIPCISNILRRCMLRRAVSLYSYNLKGFDKDWSAWSKKTEKEYTNLPAGIYTFQVKAKSNLGNESAITEYSFTMSCRPGIRQGGLTCCIRCCFPRWSYLLYYWQRRIFRQQQQRHEEERKRLQYLHQLEMEKSEKEIVNLKNEKLEAEIEHKNTELASAAMHLVQKGELLSNIREELMRMKKGVNGDGARRRSSKKCCGS